MNVPVTPFINRVGGKRVTRTALIVAAIVVAADAAFTAAFIAVWQAVTSK